MSDELVRWGVLGYARIAEQWVMPAIEAAPSARLQAIASRSLERAEEAATRFAAQQAYGSYEDLLGDADIDAVYIPLPNNLHSEWTVSALRAGKHVLCEKPLALNGDQALKMAAAAKENDRYLVEAFMYRYGPLMQRAMALVSQGRVGEVRALHSSFTFVIGDDPSNVRLQPETGGGALYDVGCYTIDVQRKLAGREPQRVYARMSRSERYGVDTSVSAVLDYGNGLRGTLDAGFDASGWTSLRVVGTEGVLQAPEGFNPRQQPGLLVLQTGSLCERLVIPSADPYLLEVQDLSEAILGEHPPRFSDEPLDANMRVIDACFRSAEEQRPVPVEPARA